MPVSYTYAFDEVLAANLRMVVNNEPREQAFIGSPTLTMMSRRPKTLQGNYIQVNVAHTGTAQGGAFVANTVLSTADVESGKVAQYTPAFYAEPARLAYTDEKKAGGSRRLFDLWAFKVKQAKNRLKQTISTDLFASSQATNGIVPFPVAIPATTTSGTWGGLDRATYTWWRNATYTSVGSYTTNGHDKMDALELDIQVDGGMRPDWYVTTKTIFQKMKKAARSTTNFNPTYDGAYRKLMNDAGIDAISWNGSPVIWDPYCDSGKVYAVTNDAFYLGTMGNVGEFDVIGPFPLQGSGIMGKVVYVVWAGQTIGEEARRLGQLSGVT